MEGSGGHLSPRSPAQSQQLVSPSSARILVVDSVGALRRRNCRDHARTRLGSAVTWFTFAARIYAPLGAAVRRSRRARAKKYRSAEPAGTVYILGTRAVPAGQI